jgi:uncharacterized protein YdhG (YjbR/CyaY superfamily)
MTVNNYLAALPAAQRDALEHIQALIRQTVPDATEEISYGMPAFKYRGHYLIGYASFKDHLSLFPGGNPLDHLSEQLKPYKRAKGTIQFTLDNPIPDDLIIAIVKSSLERVVERYGDK